jgi:hypothetical protein
MLGLAIPERKMAKGHASQKGIFLCLEEIIDRAKEAYRESPDNHDVLVEYIYTPDIQPLLNMGVDCRYVNRPIGVVFYPPTAKFLNEFIVENHTSDCYKNVIDALVKTEHDELFSNGMIQDIITNAIMPRDKSEDSIIQVVIDEIEDKPATWNVKLYLHGLVVLGGSIQTESILLRSPSPEDFTYTSAVRWEDTEARPTPGPSNLRVIYPVTAVAEASIEGIPRGVSHGEELKRAINDIVRMVRLTEDSHVQLVCTYSIYY